MEPSIGHPTACHLAIRMDRQIDSHMASLMEAALAHDQSMWACFTLSKFDS
jgi:hypothetical protein